MQKNFLFFNVKAKNNKESLKFMAVFEYLEAENWLYSFS